VISIIDISIVIVVVLNTVIETDFVMFPITRYTMCCCYCSKKKVKEMWFALLQWVGFVVKDQQTEHF
jgi:hypothetical protein